MGELPPAECLAELWVDDKDVQRAEKALKPDLSGPGWTCKCGEASGPQFAQCWKCGALRA